MNPLALPILDAPCRVASLHNGLRLDYLSDEVMIHGSASSEVLARALACFDGVTTPQTAAMESGLPVNLIIKTSVDLQHTNHCYTIVDSTAFTGEKLAKVVQKLYANWNTYLFSHPFWQYLHSGKADRALVDVWLIETYHFIKAANARLPYAISCARTPHLRRLLLEHYTEEFDHHKFFAESMQRRGIDIGDVEQAGPIAGTMAVINFTRACARLGDLHYVICSGLLESTGTDSSRAKRFYERLRELYDRDATGFVEPMLEHVSRDAALQHGSFMSAAFKSVESISLADASNIVRSGYEFVEVLRLWFSDIINHAMSRRTQPPTNTRHASSDHGLEGQGDDRVFMLSGIADWRVERSELVVETASEILRFEGKSAMVLSIAASRRDKAWSVRTLARESNVSEDFVEKHFEFLCENDALIELTSLRSGAPSSEAVRLVRSFSKHWNAEIMRQPFFEYLNSGNAGVTQVLGWGIEFLHFVKAANLYMSRGVARWDLPASLLDAVWDHYVSESRHDSIFERGLIDCGILQRRLLSPALPSTTALVNFLRETAAASIFEYLSVFAVMQPIDEAPTAVEVAKRYDFLRRHYTEAAPLFDAFQEHDMIDTGMRHHTLLLKPFLESEEFVAGYILKGIWKSMRLFAEHFKLMEQNVLEAYADRAMLHYRPYPTPCRPE